ncbi:MAG TPA: signal peptide peptidase SppA [Candidatus Latescibacteria bacterium]|nr:signal peptide peptidase SppA [Candidatus Latescibacterota bacterium]HOF60740.1 signal peptide peptidase SppA [Candidatus Latescibacterota bacterium]HOS64871.1 signal peptide peptidase SppA [Candidatus Latescibacterota bacterium]HPK73461.1 signal peptide peptidase SppA [Candidatus Latescibacterota bacterium]
MPALTRKSRRDQIIDGIVVGLIALCVLMILAVAAGSFSARKLVPGERIGLVELTGAITDPEPVNRQLRHFRDVEKVPAILLRIDSPGGYVGASQEIYRQVELIRQRGIKVIASMGNVAASGAYYVAIAADTIMANPGTITGSIGVIAEFPQADTLLRKVGLAFNIVKSGRYKDTGSPTRPMRGDEQELLQSVVDDTYLQFREAVGKARNIPQARLDSLTQGQVFTGRMAKAFGLVDALGNYDDALRLAKRMAGLSDGAKVIRAPSAEKSLFQRLLGNVNDLWHASSWSVSYRLP